MEMAKNLLINLDTLECPICRELFCLPVHQCCNGHAVCATCCEKLKGKPCPFCRSTPFAYSRCLAIEKIMESLVSSCQYAPEGCNEMVKFVEKEKHEREFCKIRPIQCPIPSCKYKSLQTASAHVISFPVHFGSHVNSDQILRLDPLSQNVKFKMTSSDAPWVLIYRAEPVPGELLLVNHLVTEKVIFFWCTSFGSNSRRYELKANPSGASSFFTLDTLVLNSQGKRGAFKINQVLPVRRIDSASQSQLFDLELRLL